MLSNISSKVDFHPLLQIRCPVREIIMQEVLGHVVYNKHLWGKWVNLDWKMVTTQTPHLVVQFALELEWLCRNVPNWGKGTGFLSSCIKQSLDVAWTLEVVVILVKIYLSRQSNLWRETQLWATSHQWSEQLGAWVLQSQTTAIITLVLSRLSF